MKFLLVPIVGELETDPNRHLIVPVKGGKIEMVRATLAVVVEDQGDGYFRERREET